MGDRTTRVTRSEVFSIFFKAGLAFGGGLGILAVLEEELVDKRRAVTKEEADLDDRDATFHWLDVAFAERNDYLMYLPIAPEFNRLHHDPRFQDLVRRVGL